MTFRLFVDMNDRDPGGRIRVGKAPSIVDGQNNPIAPEEGLEVIAHDKSIIVPGVLHRVDDRWIIDARWDQAEDDS